MKMSDKVSEIAAWEARIREIEAIVGPLSRERIALRQKIAEAESPFRAGDIIEWDVGGRGVRTRKGRVVRIMSHSFNAPELKVRRILQNGRDGQECIVRHYCNPRLAERSDTGATQENPIAK